MGRPKGSKNKSRLQNESKPQDASPAQNIPGFISNPAGRINVRVSTETKDGLAQLKDDFRLHSQEEVLEKAIAIVMALRKAVSA
ncbi:MAG: hypothetical protein JO174_16045 [Herbaspirillum sp.]|nr:hypothetical protein [Herbaspirillum sp.]